MARIDGIFRDACGLDDEATSMRWEKPRVVVEWARSGRSHEIRYEYDPGADRLDLKAIVASARDTKEFERAELLRTVVLYNRTTKVAAFLVDHRHGRVEGRVHCRASTLSPRELRFYLLCLAREADRFEYLLTGKDA